MWSTGAAPLLLLLHLLLLLAPAEGQRRPQAATQAAAAAPQQKFVSECPLPNGFFADATQCDKYYKCVDNVLSEKLCLDGLAFVDHNPRAEKCDYLTAVDCTGRPQLQPPQPAGACLRQNGYFYHPDPTICNQFFFCSEGTGNLVTCPDGLIFTNKSNNCVWADESGRSGCSIDGGVPAFECPKVSHDLAVAHPRYADPNDCQYFYVCIDGINARRNGCTFGQVFNEAIGTCTAPQEVPECSNYYTEYFDDYFKTLNTGGRPRGDIIAAAFDAGYNIPPSAFTKIDRTQTQRPQQPRGSVAGAPAAAAAPAPATQSVGTRRRRPFAAQAVPAAAPVLDPIPVPVHDVAAAAAGAAPVDSFSLSTDFGAHVEAAADPPRRRRPLVRRTQRPIQ